MIQILIFIATPVVSKMSLSIKLKHLFKKSVAFSTLEEDAYRAAKSHFLQKKELQCIGSNDGNILFMFLNMSPDCQSR